MIPVARKVWLPIRAVMPAAGARRRGDRFDDGGELVTGERHGPRSTTNLLSDKDDIIR